MRETPMDMELRRAFRTGYERLAAWADLVDRINVFPVADGDTGRNLVLSLAPLHDLEETGRDRVVRELLLSSRGMSGNIGTRFFSELLRSESTEDLPETALAGRAQAWEAVDDPRPGTVLSLFDILCDALTRYGYDGSIASAERIVSELESGVLATTDRLPVLREAGVVDAGALGCFLFFEGFFAALTGQEVPYRSVREVFGERLTPDGTSLPEEDCGFCVDVVLDGVHEPARGGGRYSCPGWGGCDPFPRQALESPPAHGRP